jgi:hypothetical protein
MTQLNREKIEALINEGKTSSRSMVNLLESCRCGNKEDCTKAIQHLPCIYMSTTLGSLSALSVQAPHLIQGHEYYSGDTKKHGVLIYVTGEANDHRLTQLIAEFRTKLELLKGGQHG